MKNSYVVVFVAAATLGVGAAVAQDTATLEEIVVTASKREQTLNDIPSAVSVTSAETIEKAHITDILDLHTAVPSLRTSQLQTSTQTNFIIRGFGNGANNPGIESSVGVFIDGVYRSRSASQIGDLIDVERIEVLRGPQSTLFGQNASVGVISVITSKPSFTPTGSIEVGFGDYNAKMVRAGVSGPMSDRAAFSLSGNYNERDGYFKNLTSGHEINDRERWDLRGQLLINATDDLTFRLIADTSSIDELCCGVSNLEAGPTADLINSPLVNGQIYTGNPYDRRGYFNKDPTNSVDNEGVSMQVDWTHGDWTVTSITADRTQKAKFDYDADFTSADILATNLNDSRIHTFTEELRLVFDNGGPVTGLLGGYYFDENVNYENTLTWGDDIRPYATYLIAAQSGSLTVLSDLEAALAAAAGLPPGSLDGILLHSGQGQVITTHQDSKVTTLFGQLDWKIVDRLTLTAGLAYAKTKKDVSIAQTDTDVFSSLNFVNLGFGGALAAGLPAALADQASVCPAPPAVPPPYCNNPALVNPLLGLYPYQFLAPVVPFSDNSDDSETTYTARLAYDINDDLMVYGGVSTGFKATSWNLSRDTRPVQPAVGDRSPLGGFDNPYYARYGTRFAGPEESTVYEIGFKGKWQRTALNVAIFDEEIKDFQSNTFLGTGFGLLNAGKQSVQGGEFDLLFVPSEHWEFSLAGTFLDPLYDSFVIGPAVQNQPGDSPTTDLSGTTPAGISSFTGVATATYRWSAGSFDSFVRANFDHESSVRVIENVPADVATREVNTVNASAGMSRDGWDFELWGHNLTDDNYPISAFPSVAQAGSYSGYPSQPRTYGVTIRKRF